MLKRESRLAKCPCTCARMQLIREGRKGKWVKSVILDFGRKADLKGERWWPLGLNVWVSLLGASLGACRWDGEVNGAVGDLPMLPPCGAAGGEGAGRKLMERAKARGLTVWGWGRGSESKLVCRKLCDRLDAKDQLVAEEENVLSCKHRT